MLRTYKNNVLLSLYKKDAVDSRFEFSVDDTMR